jgi:hypothetical protein
MTAVGFRCPADDSGRANAARVWNDPGRIRDRAQGGQHPEDDLMKAGPS